MNKRRTNKSTTRKLIKIKTPSSGNDPNLIRIKETQNKIFFEFKETRIELKKRTIKSQNEFDGFKAKDTILMLVLESNKPNQSVELIQKIKEMVPRFKQNGLSGIYFDTPNHDLIKFFLRTFKGFEIKETATPEEIKKRIKKFYSQRIKAKSFSKKHLNTEIKRVVLKF